MKIGLYSWLGKMALHWNNKNTACPSALLHKYCNELKAIVSFLATKKKII